MINNYKVKINGKKEPVYNTKVRVSMNRAPSVMPFVIGESAGEASVEIHSEVIITDACIRPSSAGVKFEFDEHVIRFTAPECAKLSVEINNDVQTAIGIFMNKPINKPEGTTKFYPAGMYDESFIELHDNDIMYLEKGAYVKGKILATGKNIKICGNGIISGEIFEEHPYDRKYAFLVEIDNCQNCEISDVTLIQSPEWNMRLNGCDDTDVSEVKIIGYRGNNDGIDVCGSRNVEVHDCFIRSTDDCLTVKGFNTGDAVNNHFYKCTLWNDYANPIRVGGIRAEKAENLVFEDIDIIHISAGYPCFAFLEGNRAAVDGVKVENLRIEDSKNAYLFDVRMKRNLWTTDKQTGSLKNISFKNIYLYGSEPKEYLPQESVICGHDENSRVSNVTFENIYVYGKQITSLEECCIDVREFVDDVKFIYDGKADKGIRAEASFGDMQLLDDGYYHGSVILTAKNEGDRKITAMIRPEIFPDYTHTYSRFEMTEFAVDAGEAVVKEYEVKLRPGRYMITAEANSIEVQPSRNVYEFVHELKEVDRNTLENLTKYPITNLDGGVVAEAALGKDSEGIWCLAEILNEKPCDEVPSVSLYVSKKPEFKEGDAYFSCEETGEGKAAALVYSDKGLKTEPIMRCNAEIRWTLNNAPSYEKTVCVSTDANGVCYKDNMTKVIEVADEGNTFTAVNHESSFAKEIEVDSQTKDNKTKMIVYIPYKELGFKPEEDIVAELTVKPVLTKNRYMNAFSLYGSTEPTTSVHMYCPVK